MSDIQALARAVQTRLQATRQVSHEHPQVSHPRGTAKAAEVCGTRAGVPLSHFLAVGRVGQFLEPFQMPPCAHCGKPGMDTDIVPFLAAGGGHTWLHRGCWRAWMQGRTIN